MNEMLRERGRILVVDDESPNLRLLDKMLRSQGYSNLVLIEDPRQVVQRYRSARPDLVLLDINMPHLDGFEVLEQLKGLQDPLMPPIVMLTAQHGKEFMLRALSAGARDFITKPFDRNELLMRVRNLLDAHMGHRLLHDQKTWLEETVWQRTSELRRTRLDVVQRLGKAAEYRDEETGAHVLRMSYSCALLAKEYGWNESQTDMILNASPMHDIGKIGIPDAILLKPGKLEPHEWEVMKTHVTIGAGMLEGDSSSLIKMAHEIALTHHEKWDGSGYPHGLAGADIPLSGRIAALADVFDALTSERPYKKAWTVEAAMDLVRENRGKHFDPDLVDVLEANLSGVEDIRERFKDDE
ncbi:two-component system response regulator [Kineobactrum sediminis]|uniref:Two-component system response regulator n=1 Tax=Kineobactrum sediminis TaxID=1905677 RepID=A0A2N5Y6D8_9GAMM|nr:HD domain-containing phosphohydrolase [Kineobactrum sediminis]PLW83947.1 two-component system response regulator [Kineobactrum sediminis]